MIYCVGFHHFIVLTGPGGPGGPISPCQQKQNINHYKPVDRDKQAATKKEKIGRKKRK